MRILHINCNYLGSTLHQTMVENLRDLGFENQVYVPTYNDNLAVIEPNENVCVSKCFKKWDRVFFDYKQRKIRKDIEEKIDIKQFDAIHAYTLFTDGNCAMKLAKKYDKPFIVTIRNTDVNDFLKKMIVLRSRGLKIMKSASRICFLSETYYKQVFNKYVPKNNYEELKQKVEIIPNGIDSFWLKNSLQDEFLNNKKIGMTVKLIYAGKIDKNKNIPTIQRAMAILQKNRIEAELKVIGKVSDKSEFNKIISDKKTKYLNAMSREQLLREYRDSDIFVMPSFTESFGLVYAEAMSQGLPVLYSKGQGFDGQFVDGEVGYAVLATNADDVAKKIIKVIQNYPELTARVTKRAERFNWKEIVQKYECIYKDIVKKQI